MPTVVLHCRTDSIYGATHCHLTHHVANALQWLGALYRNLPDALTEHVSNAIDEHLKAMAAGHGPLDKALVAHGLQTSAWAHGAVRGVIDATFLTPLPARSGLEEDEDWVALLDLLDR